MIKVLDIPFFDKSIPDAVDLVICHCKRSDKAANYCISASGAHGLVEANKDAQFKKVLQSFWLNLPDGMPTVWIGKLKGARLMKRCYGPDFFKALMIASANTSIKHFFCGGNAGVANELKNAVANKFGNYQVVGTNCPPFRKMTESEMEQLGSSITQSGADIVWIGISSPKQELMAYELKRFTKTKLIITVGAAFDFHIGRVKQAPYWMQQNGLEWFFRLLMEPKRLFKRYATIVPQFIWLNIIEYVTFLLKRNS